MRQVPRLVFDGHRDGRGVGLLVGGFWFLIVLVTGGLRRGGFAYAKMYITYQRFGLISRVSIAYANCWNACKCSHLHSK